MRRVCTTNQILHEIIAAFHMLDHIGIERIKALGRHLCVVFPPNGVNNAVCFHDMLVLGGPAGKFASRDKKRAAIAQCAFVAFERGFDQRGLHKIVKDIAQPADPLIL